MVVDCKEVIQIILADWVIGLPRVITDHIPTVEGEYVRHTGSLHDSSSDIKAETCKFCTTVSQTVNAFLATWMYLLVFLCILHHSIITTYHVLAPPC